MLIRLQLQWLLWCCGSCIAASLFIELAPEVASMLAAIVTDVTICGWDVLKWLSLLERLIPRSSYRRGRINTVDLLVLTSSH
jgi:hypothetical protein